MDARSRRGALFVIGTTMTLTACGAESPTSQPDPLVAQVETMAVGPLESLTIDCLTLSDVVTYGDAVVRVTVRFETVRTLAPDPRVPGTTSLARPR